VTEQEAIESAIGVVTALQAELLGDEGWRELLDVVIGDLSPSDTNDLILQMGGLVLGCVTAMTHAIPALRGLSVEDYLHRLGQAAQILGIADENQGRLFDDE
jgi:hypothetical protein